MLRPVRRVRARAGPGRARRDEAGTLSLELVLVVPVLVLLTVFVLWAGRGGRAALTADLAAEEAATAAALCCDEDSGGASGREALVEDVLEARPGLGFLCIGGPRPDAGVGSDEFLSERWLEFEPGRGAGGVGVLGVQFLCESDGAVAPLRGLFPTVTFHGQASEVVLQEPRFVVGFKPTRVEVVEGTDPQLVFTVRVEPAQGEEVTLTYVVVAPDTTAAPEDFDGGFAGLNLNSSGVGTVVIPAIADSAQIVLPLFDDDFFEGEEELVLNLTGALPPAVQLDEDRRMAAGVITDNDPQPFLQIRGAPQVTEGGTLSFVVRVGKEDGVEVDDIAQSFTVQVSTLDDAVARGGDCDWAALGEDCPWATANQDYNPVDDMLTFSPGGELSVPVVVATLDDESSPVGEPTEYVRLVLSGASAGAPALHTVHGNADGKILDDEATASISDVTPQDAAEGDPVVFRVDLDRAPTADVTLDYAFEPDGRPGAHLAARAAGDSCTPGDDYLGAAGQVTVTAPSQQATFEVPTCPDVLVERGETFWVGLSRAENGGEVVVPAGTGEWGTIRNDDIAVVSIVADPPDARGVEGQTPLKFTVGLTVGGQPAQLTEGVAVDYEIGGFGTDPATAPGPLDADYAVTLDTATPPELSGPTLEGTLAFTVGSPAVTEHVFEVELLADHLPEGEETFELDLDNLMDPVGAAVFEDRDSVPGTDDSFAVGTIEDDAPPVLSVGDFTGAEGSDQSFAVTLARARAGETVTVDYAIAGAGAHGATNPAAGETLHDYNAATGSLSGRLTFPGGAVQLPDGSLRHSVGVSLLPDAINEYPETLRLVLSDPHMAVLADRDPGTVGVQAYGEGTIEDVDPPVLSVSDFTGSEGSDGSFVVSLAGARAGQTVTVDYAIAGAGAHPATDPLTGATLHDYTVGPDPQSVPDSRLLRGRLEFTYPLNERTVEVSLRPDAIDEYPETLRLTLTNPSAAVLSGSDRDNSINEIHGVGTIEDVDPPVLSVSDFTGSEGSDGSFVVSLAGARAGQTVTVDYAIAGAGAHPATDPLTGATLHDYTVGPDPQSVPDSRLLRGRLEFTYPLNERTVEVSLRPDAIDEYPETLRLTLTNPSAAVLSGSDRDNSINEIHGVGTIEDVDPPVLSVSDFTGSEGSDGSFVVSLAGARAGQTVTVDYAIAGAGAHPATDPLTGATLHDYTVGPDPQSVPDSRLLRGRLEFTYPLNERTVEVSLRPDAIDEADETVALVLILAPGTGNAGLGDSVGTGTITNVGSAWLSVDNTSAREGEPLTFTVTLCNPTSGEDVAVSYQTRAHSAAAGLDFVAAGDTLDFPDTLAVQQVSTGCGAGVDAKSRTVQVTTLNDSLEESDEDVHLVLSEQTPASIGFGKSIGVGRIINVSTASVRVNAPTAVEGSPLVFEISLVDNDGDPAVITEPVTVHYATEDRTATTGTDCADTDTDYLPIRSSVTFTPGGVTSVEVENVETCKDNTYEDDETVALVLTLTPGTRNAGIGDSEGTGTIIDVDSAWLSVDNTSAREGEPLTFTVTLCNPTSGEDVAVSYQTRAHSAAAGLDFVAAGDTLDFPDTLAVQQVSTGCGAGVDAKSRTVQVTTLTDRVEESDEEVHLVLSNRTPASVRFGKSIGVGRIINVSAATVRVNDPTAAEGSPLVFEISLVDNDGDPAVITEPVTVHYATEDRTATTGTDCADTDTDYLPIRSSVTFTPGGVTSVEVENVETCIDNTYEDDETVALVLTLATGTRNAGLGDSEGTGTIIDVTLGLRIEDAIAAEEGDPLTFRVTLVDDDGLLTSTNQIVSFTVSTEDGTATDGEDYTAVTNLPLEIPVGDSGVEFMVETLEDDNRERNEWLAAVLSNPSNALIDRAHARGEITWKCVDDTEMAVDAPVITVLPRRHVEGEAFDVAFELSRPMCNDFTIRYQAQSGTAECSLDFDCRGVATQLRLVRFRTGPFIIASQTVYADGIDEPDEMFTMEVSWERPMPFRWRRLPPAVGEYWIIDGDPAPSLRISDAAANEGEDLTFDVSLDTASGREVNVQYRTVQRSGTNAADPVDDYEPVTDWSPIAFAPGATLMPIMVRAVIDGDSEDDETFLVELREPPDPSTPLNAVIVDSVAVGTIVSSSKPRMRIVDDYGDEGDTFEFLVRLSEPAPGPVTVSYATAELTGLRAAGAGDYEPVNGSLAFAAGDTWKSIYVDVHMDNEPEVDEVFLVELSGPSPNVVLTDSSAVGTIKGDFDCFDPGDTTPSRLTVDSPRAREDEGTLVFELTLDWPRCVATDIDVAPSSDFGGFVDRPGIATSNVDYVLRDRNLRIPRLATVLRVEVELTNDAIGELIETVELIAVGRCNNDPTCPPSITMTGTIIDDGSQLRLPSPDALTEGGVFSFVVRLDLPSVHPVTFTYETVEGLTATPGTDFVPVQGTAEIPAGELSVTVRVATRDDALEENDERLGVRVSDLVGALPDPDGDVIFGTITDDDGPPSVRVWDASVDEGGDLEFTVILDGPSGREVSVPVATSDGTARAAEGDYVARASRDLVFAPGVTRQVVRVQTLADNVVESVESVWLHLGPMEDGTATIGDGLGRGLIRDVSDRRVSVSDASVVEGGTLVFEVGFAEGPSGRDVVVRYRTRAGTAAAGGDYDDSFESVPQELRIVAGDTSAMVLVPTVGDSLDEDNESLELVLSDPQGAVIVAGAASGVIIDDDPLPALRVGDTEASEGDGASAVFTLSLSEASGRPVTVTYDTADGTAAARTATDPGDFVAATGAMTVMAAGETSATVDVALVDDDDAEDVETFRLVVSGVTNASLVDSTGVATVIDDDGLVQVLVDDPAAVYEGEGASAVFTVRLSRAHTTEAVTVAYSTVDGTAAAGSDYIAASDTLTFAATDIVMTVSVPLVNDDTAEDPETFRLVLSSPSSNAELGDGEASVLIRDDDGLPTVSVADAAARTEGSAASFTVTLSRAVPQEVTVDYAAVADPLAAAETAAVPGQDYTAVSGTVRFAARATEATVTVPLPDDSLDENTETFWLRLASPVGATIADGTATGVIVDDDPLAEIRIGNAGATEGSPVSFTVSLEPVSGRTVTVPWATEALAPGTGAASPGDDYTAASGTLSLAPGSSTARLEVESLPDDIAEADETFLVQLGTPTSAALDDGTAIGAIRDDDGLPRVFIAHTTVTEDNSPAIFTVTLSHPSSLPVTVAYSTADGTAHSPPADPYDYVPDEERTLTIPAAFTLGEISVFIVDDILSEGTETFTITLTDPVNAVIAEGAGTATGYILDDDKSRIAIGVANAYENDGAIEFPVTLSAASTDPITVRYTTFDGTATQPDDYTAATGTLTIPANHTTDTIAVTLTDDGFVEDPESFLVRLHDPVGAEIATAEATGVILDDDNLPLLAIATYVFGVNEDAGSVTMRVTLDRPSDEEVTVDYYAGDSYPLTCPSSVALEPGTLVFAPGAVVGTIDVAIVNDPSLCSWSRLSPYRGFSVFLRDPRNAQIDWRSASAGFNVYDLQRAPCVEFGGFRGAIAEDAGVVVIPVGLQRTHGEDVTLTVDTGPPRYWSVFNVPATAGDDYTALSSHTVVVPAGTLHVPLEVAIINDSDPEESEGFLVTISSAVGADVSCQGFLRWYNVGILDDDSSREFSVSDVSVPESGTAIFVVSLEAAATSEVTVAYTTVDGSAVQPGDYTAASGVVRIPAGDAEAVVEVMLVDDTDAEPDETFTLMLSGAVGADIADAEATATIQDNDGSDPVVRIAHDVTVLQGLNAPPLSIRSFLEDGDIVSVFEEGHGDFRAVLDEPATSPVMLTWSAVAVPSLGEEAADGGDFAIISYPATIPVGDTEVWLSIHLREDTIPEPDERFLLVFNDSVNAELDIGHVWVNILNNDLPIVTIADSAVDESAGNVVFNVQLHAAAVQPARLRYSTAVNGSAEAAAATPDQDYTTVSGTLGIPAGATSATITVPVIADSVDEPHETFLLVLSDPELLSISDSVAVGTITDDDPGWVIDDRSVWEYAASMVFTVIRDHTSTGDVAVDYRFGDGGSAVGGTACTVDGVDFEWPSGSASGTVTMPAADTEAAISVTVCDDDLAEGSEILLIELTGVPGRKLTGVGTIVDND